MAGHPRSSTLKQVRYGHGVAFVLNMFRLKSIGHKPSSADCGDRLLLYP